ncbi:hypothetical protein J2S49_000775 [Arcanobacterium wilhelmae]|uniref:Antitoxin n=1 Tax=Arcanobacterium wilhelmae TaxID=1803177 RepID=A0ABT9NAE8_9ACTO|nr:Rv0909 family putative TA system antitoxin [Arcanobacterium wilhelmae]MDP9800699.1 hypothetical protein [Arcanobacterium wilhelmae]WFN90098.1 Rv0909 family putative TA system antitoxin [Arcanobacterium wilhelmae]
MGIFDKAKEALNSEKAEELTDKALDAAEGFATDKLGADKADQVKGVRDQIDSKLGNE